MATATTVHNALSSRRRRQKRSKTVLVLMAMAFVFGLCLSGMTWSLLKWRRHIITQRQQQAQQFEFTPEKHVASQQSPGQQPPPPQQEQQQLQQKKQTTPQQPMAFPLVICQIVTPHHPQNGAHGSIRMTVRTDVAPKAAKAFLYLVETGYYNDVFIPRVVPNFVAQWGIRAGGNDAIKWQGSKPSKTDRDAVTAQSLSNTRGTVTFAGGNPTTGQVFVNLSDKNVRLDMEGARPFATIDDDASMLLLDQLYTGYPDGSGQVQALHQGRAATLETFPQMSLMESCRRVASSAAT